MSVPVKWDWNKSAGIEPLCRHLRIGYRVHAWWKLMVWGLLEVFRVKTLLCVMLGPSKIEYGRGGYYTTIIIRNSPKYYRQLRRPLEYGGGNAEIKVEAGFVPFTSFDEKGVASRSAIASMLLSLASYTTEALLRGALLHFFRCCKPTTSNHPGLLKTLNPDWTTRRPKNLPGNLGRYGRRAVGLGSPS